MSNISGSLELHLKAQWDSLVFHRMRWFCMYAWILFSHHNIVIHNSASTCLFQRICVPSLLRTSYGMLPSTSCLRRDYSSHVFCEFAIFVLMKPLFSSRSWEMAQRKKQKYESLSRSSPRASSSSQETKCVKMLDNW